MQGLSRSAEEGNDKEHLHCRAVQMLGSIVQLGFGAFVFVCFVLIFVCLFLNMTATTHFSSEKILFEWGSGTFGLDQHRY